MWRLASLISLTMLCSTGCSSLGFSLWPSQFPLLSQTKEFASKSPLPSGLPHELAKQVLPDYFVEPGDRLLIEPVELDSDFRTIGDQKVQVDGSIDLGEFGRLRVAGLTVEAIEAAIERQLAEESGQRETINVQLVETNAAEVYVLGEVGSPGAYALDGNETVLDAIVMAGGLTSKASPCDMILVRPTAPAACRVVLRVCYRQITQLGDVTTNYQVQPGDRIVVGSRTLREELAFWRQTRDCECCNRSRCVECNPARLGFPSRFVGWLSPFPKSGGENSQAMEGSAESLDESPPDSEPRESIPPHQPEAGEDADIFLPAEAAPMPNVAPVIRAPQARLPSSRAR
ncbi:MAG: polysaccharide export protein [Planctomycetales bacterium]|nr:polysaccharide export protein [Planctomycetales bacterium]